MNQKAKRILFGIIGTTLIILDFIMMYYYFDNFLREKDPYNIGSDIKIYMREHGMNEKDYNFDNVILTPQNALSLFFEIVLTFIFLFINIGYLLGSIIGIIIYNCGLKKEKIFFINCSISIFGSKMFIGIIDICVAFTHPTLTGRDLSDFGELNVLIKQTYDLYLESKLYMKLISFYLFFSPIFFLVISFLQLRKMRKNNNNNLVQPMAQNIINQGTTPVNQNINPNANYPLKGLEVNNLYNQPNDGVIDNVKNDI